MRPFFQAVILSSVLRVCLAQTAPPSFEVTTIRPNRSGAVQSAVFFQPGRFVAENATVKMLIAYAYAVRDFQISGGPSWMESERFNITAKEDESVSVRRQKLPWKQYRKQLGLMVQAMLADRFHLRVVHRPKEACILALVGPSAWLGPKQGRRYRVMGGWRHGGEATSLLQLPIKRSREPESSHANCFTASAAIAF